MDVSRVIESAAERVWDLITDTNSWPVWGPSVKAVRCPGRYIRLGTKGEVKTPLGWMPFEITSWQDGLRWSWRVAGVPATGHRLEPLSPVRCRLTFEVPFWALPYAAVCRLALKRIARQVE